MMRLREIVFGAIQYPTREYRKLRGHYRRRNRDESPALDLGLWSRLHPSLREGYKYCLAVVASVWIICFVFAIWVAATSKASAGLVYTLQIGNCATVRGVNFWVHLLINILASAMYAVSSYVMQRLTAPTREDIDTAHSAGEELKIGSLAISNLALLGRKRWLVFALLWASSLPIHLVCNSLVVYSSTNAEWPSFVFLVSADWLNSAFESERPTYPTSITRQYDQILGLTDTRKSPGPQYIFHQQPPLVDLRLTDCIETFGSGSNEIWSDVILVQEFEEGIFGWNGTYQLKEPLIPSDSYLPTTSNDPWSWMCGHNPVCDTRSIFQNGTWTIDGEIITRCLGRKLPELCELDVSLAIMTIVLICISCKLVGIILAISLGRSQSLLTIGDAIASFLQDPNMASPNYRPLYSSRRKIAMRELKAPFWASSIFGLASLSLAWWFFNYTFSETKAAYVNSKTGFDFNTMLRFGFGQMPTMWTDRLRKDLISYGDAENPSFTYTSGATLANLPQVALSAFYLVFNNYITRLFVALEFRSFSTRRRGLRVSEPSKGTKQRRAHFLQIPLRYSLLVMAIFAVLHTFLSQTLFLRRVYAIYPQSLNDPNDIGKKLLPMIGYSPVSCFALAILLTVLVVSSIIVGLIPIDWRFPDTSGSSLAISAACHPPEGTENSHEGAVRWGVTNRNTDGTVKCSFSLLPVRPPDVGEWIRRRRR